MCYANLGTLICQACGRRVGEQPVGTTPCLAGCGKYVSRVTGAVGAAWGRWCRWSFGVDKRDNILWNSF
ncbi:hypothetical protein CEP53_006799 [Fusarium sp. AF-6]|nr:hypothetical protein CEP53_006799 [Fusarium sp. AF-6]